MALLSNPSLLLLDEPTTPLDVTVEAGIIELIGQIAEKFNTSMVYISHNLGLILETCQRINVMYSGDRSSVVEGQRGSVRVDRGGRSIINKTTAQPQHIYAGI